MLSTVALALALFGGGSTIQTTAMSVAGWTLRVRKDTFTGDVSCRARRGGVTVQNGVAVFALGRHVNTADAFYRLDQNAAHSVHEVSIRVRALGAPVLAEPIDNPSRGLVLLPAADVIGSQQVWIRATPKAAPRLFTTAGLQDVMAQEQTAGCA